MPHQVTYLRDAPETPRAFLTAISLHGHTRFSRESLDFIPAFARRNRLLDCALSRQRKRCKDVQPDFATAYWTPPLTASAAYQLERSQIENDLNLASIVSLTDHDCIEAPLQLRSLPDGDEVPISLEWTVPFRDTDLHVGVHNLPGGKASSFLAEMQAYTNTPREEVLTELLSALSGLPGVLVVLNHPLWDIGQVGITSHRRSLNDFLRRHNPFLHAFELNGARPWKENQAIREFAQGWYQPVVSGGDRHGCEANAVLNLTRATTMAEFVHEVRREGRTHVLFMPQYQQPLTLRVLQTVLDVIRDYPVHPLGCNWDDRVFHPDAGGTMRPLSALWQQPPQFIETIFAALRLLESDAARRLTGVPLSGARNQQPLSLRPGGEAA